MTNLTPTLLTLPAKANILIDQDGHARLADFGLLTIISDPRYLLSSSSHTQGGTARWMSPERINPQQFGFKDSCPSKPSDCYSLGMVIYETISGNIPFHKHADLTVFMKVMEGEHPPRGVRFTESLWKVLELCWEPQPNDRPSIEDVLQCLDGGLIFSESPSPGVAKDLRADDGDRGSVSDSSGSFLTSFPLQYFTVSVCSMATDISTFASGDSHTSISHSRVPLPDAVSNQFTLCSNTLTHFTSVDATLTTKRHLHTSKEIHKKSRP